jgi:tetratricopeptide (TPR) repeat protein
MLDPASAPKVPRAASARRLAGIAVLAAVVVGAALAYHLWRRDADYQALVAQGDQAMAAGDTAAAIEAFSGAIALKPRSMLGWLKRGETYFLRGDHRSALRDLRRATSLDPAALRPLELLGDTNLALERFARAAEHYRACLALDDREHRLHYKLALALYQDGRPDEARTVLGHAARLDDAVPEAHYLLGLCLTEVRRHREAARSLERAVELSPSFLAAREALAARYRVLGRATDELRQLEALAALDPRHEARYVALAEGYARHGRPDLAVTTLARALERFPGAGVLLVALGRTWLGVAEDGHDPTAVAKAREALRRAVAATPSSTALTLLGRAELLAGEPGRAFQTLVRAAAVVPVDDAAFRTLADAAERLGRHLAARDALIQDAALQGAREAARLRAARAARIASLSIRGGDAKTAVEWLERAVEAAPGNAVLAARLAALRRSGRAG